MACVFGLQEVEWWYKKSQGKGNRWKNHPVIRCKNSTTILQNYTVNLWAMLKIAFEANTCRNRDKFDNIEHQFSLAI